MNKINFSAVFNRKKETDKQGKALVHIRANQDNKNVYFSTDIKIIEKQWNNEKKELRNSHPQYISLNLKISKLQNELINLAQKIEDKNGYVSLDLLKEYYTNSDKLNNSFIDFYETELNHSKLASATFTTQKTTLNELREFKRQILFDDLNFELMTDFEKHLQKKGLHPNTIHKYFRHIKKYVNIGICKDRIDINRNPFKKLKIKQAETHKEYLNSEHFEKILNFTLPKGSEHLQKAYDMFVFSLYSGLRFSDIAHLPKEALKYDIQHGNYLELNMIKTGTYVFIPLDKLFAAMNSDAPAQNTPLNIIKRNFDPENEFIFKTVTNQPINRQLKDIAELVGISLNLTFHMARHTITMYLLNDCSLDLFAVGKLLGHKKIETTRIYAKLTNKGLLNPIQLVTDNQKRKQEKILKIG